MSLTIKAPTALLTGQAASVASAQLNTLFSEFADPLFSLFA